MTRTAHAQRLGRWQRRLAALTCLIGGVAGGMAVVGAALYWPF